MCRAPYTTNKCNFNQLDLLVNGCGNTVVRFIRRHFARLQKTFLIFSDKAAVKLAGNAGRAQMKAMGRRAAKTEGQRSRRCRCII